MKTLRKISSIKAALAQRQPRSGQHVLVTGASSGIGAAIARALAAQRAHLVLLGRHRQRLQRVLGADSSAASVHCVAVDFERPAKLQKTLRQLRASLPALDVIVHAAGSYSAARLGETTPADVARLWQVNVEAAMRLTLELRGCLSASGDVVFVNSSIVQRATLEAAYYAATKHALRALADSLRAELNASGVRVTSLFPGRTATPLQARAARAAGKTYQPERLIQPADIAALVVTVLSLPRSVEVTEVFLRPTTAPAPG